MGNLINPISSRLGYVKYWDSTWATTSKNNYSLNSTSDLYLKSYMSKIMSKLDKILGEDSDVDIVSYKTLYLKSEFYIAIYFASTWSYEEYEALSEFFLRGVTRFARRLHKKLADNRVQRKRKPILNRSTLKHKSSWHVWRYQSSKPKANIQLKKQSKKLRKSSSVSKKAKKVTRKQKQLRKQKLLKINNLKEIRYKKLIKTLQENLSGVIEKWPKVSRYNAYRRQVFPSAQLLLDSIVMRNLIEDMSVKASTWKPKTVLTASLENSIWLSWVDYILYMSRLRFVKRFIAATLTKFISTKDIKFVFVRQRKSALTADLLSYYVATRLQLNFPLRSLIKTFIRQLKFELHYAGILGFKIVCSGRFERRGRASYEWKAIGHTANTNYELDLDYSLRLVTLTNSICAIKIWLVSPAQNEKVAII